jgi:hypothetical protein
MYRVVAKSASMTPEAEFIADALLGKPISEHMLYLAVRAYLPDGVLVVDDDGVFRVTYRGDLVPARAGVKYKTIPGDSKELDRREYWQEMKLVKQMALDNQVRYGKQLPKRS